MLTSIEILHFATVDNLSLQFEQGLTVITGETGAGKSILIGALGLVLGNRANANIIRAGKKRAEIIANFDIKTRPEAIEWLQKNDLDEEGENSCQLRRVIGEDGRSRAYINGRTVPLQHLKSLSKLLINIHSQHQHLSLLQKEHQLKHLDQYAGHENEVQKLSIAYNAWHESYTDLQIIKDSLAKKITELELLTYQLEELDTFFPEEGEWEKIQKELQQLTKADDIIDSCFKVIQSISGEGQNSFASTLSKNLYQLSQLKIEDDQLLAAQGLIDQAQINLEEANGILHVFMNGINQDPQRLKFIEDRISQYFELARKHRVKPEELYDHYQKLSERLKSLQNQETEISSKENELETLEEQYFSHAKKLSKERIKYAKILSADITKQIHELGMEHGEFDVKFHEPLTLHPQPKGMDNIEFYVRTNLGQDSLPIVKVVSGGELSRISLAIQVLTAQTHYPPTLIFDEVDVGIGGRTANSVGKLIRKLGDTTQVLCITHLPQVAVHGHHHFYVEKLAKDNETTTRVRYLNAKERKEEIARMLGGDNSSKAMEHAESLLANSI